MASSLLDCEKCVQVSGALFARWWKSKLICYLLIHLADYKLKGYAVRKKNQAYQRVDIREEGQNHALQGGAWLLTIGRGGYYTALQPSIRQLGLRLIINTKTTTNIPVLTRFKQIMSGYYGT
jgi:hypothetical protein